MPDLNAFIVLGLTAALIAVFAGFARPSRDVRDLRITRGDVSLQMLEVIPGVTPSLAGRIRGLSASGHTLDEAVLRLLPPDHAQRLSLMVQGGVSK
jgi:hypothetical protein